MKKLFIVIGICVSMALISAFTYPSNSQLREAADAPELATSLIEGASMDESLGIAYSILEYISVLRISQEEKVERAKTIGYIVGVIGPTNAVNMLLHIQSLETPYDGLPIALPLAPPIAKKYKGQ